VYIERERKEMEEEEGKRRKGKERWS